MRQTWRGRWISAPGASGTDYGVYHFRKTIDLAARPERFIVHASGDNRYQLFANGRRVMWGPARGDLFHRRYETLDLAPYLQSGSNVLAMVVWSFGDRLPSLEGDTADTGPSWKALHDEAYSPLAFTGAEMRGYYVVGPCDRVAGAQYPWRWERADFDDSKWPQAGVEIAAGREASDPHTRWLLVPRPIPLEEETPERLQRLRRNGAACAGICRRA